MANVGAIIAKYQITNGGPVILFQAENEYTSGEDGVVFPNGYYMQYVEDQIRNAGIVVPIVNNDARAAGHNAPGTGLGEVDIYVSDAPSSMIVVCVVVANIPIGTVSVCINGGQ